MDDPQGPATGLTGRRERAPNPGSAVLADTLGAKVLHGWLQNRHQTLMPLTLNVALMTLEQQEQLAAILASLLLAGRPGEAAGTAAPMLRDWFAGLGGDAAALAAFEQAMSMPLPLNVIFDLAQSSELTIYTYVSALMASDTRYPVSVMLCDMVQARFDLPSAAGAQRDPALPPVGRVSLR